MKIYRGIDQGSPDWFSIRMGVPTASCFSEIMTPKTRKLSASWKTYACRLIAERLLNEATESLHGIEHMERGKAEEPNAVRRFEAVTETDTQPLTFIKTNDGAMGCSPDRVVLSAAGARLLPLLKVDKDTDTTKPLDATGTDFARLVEIKCPSLPVWLRYQLFGRDAEYECQLQGQMLISETDENIFYAYHPHAPQQLTIVTHRDEAFIKDLSATLREFNDKLHEFHQLALKLGDWQSFTRVVTPIDRELSADELADFLEGDEGADALGVARIRA